MIQLHQPKTWLIVLLLTLTCVGLVGQAPTAAAEQLSSIPYWSDATKESALLTQANNQIYGNPQTDASTYIKGATALDNDASQLASTIENDVISVIKDTKLKQPAQVAAIKDIVYKIYRPANAFVNASPSNGADTKAYVAQFGIVNFLRMYLGQCTGSLGSDPYCSNQSWYSAPNGDNAYNYTGPNQNEVRTATAYYLQQAAVKQPFYDRLSINNDGTLTETTGIVTEINQFLKNLDDATLQSKMLTLKTSMLDPTDPTKTINVPEYSLASSQLYMIVSKNQSLITNKDYTFFWTSDYFPGAPAASLTTLTDLTADFQLVAYVRAKTIYEKNRSQKQAQYSLATQLTKEVSDVYGTLTASPYDMSTVVSTLSTKFATVKTLGSTCSAAEQGYIGCTNSNIEPMNMADNASQETVIQNAIEAATQAVENYTKTYQGSPNLGDPNTIADMGKARASILAARDSILRYLSEMTDTANQRINEATLNIDQLANIIGNQLSSLTSVNSLWTELRKALMNLITWLFSIFGKILNFGMTSINNEASLNAIFTLTVGLANMMFVLLVALAGLAIALEWNVQTYSIRNIIWRFIVSVIAANASFLISRIFVDFSLIFSNVFLSMASTLTSNTTELFIRMGTVNGTSTLGLSSAALSHLFGSLLTSNTAAVANNVFQNDISAVLVLVVIMLIVAAVDIMLIVRTAAMWLLIIGSPFILALNVLPNTRSILSKFAKIFAQLLVIAPIVAMIFLIGISLAQLSDDLLKILIGIATFTLMLLSPSFLSFFSNIVKINKRSDARTAIATAYNNNSAPTSPPGSSAKPNSPTGPAGTSIKNTFNTNIKNFINRPKNETMPAGLGELPPQSILTAVKSGVLNKLPPEELDKAFSKMSKAQREALLSTFNAKDRNSDPLWTEDQQELIGKQVSKSDINGAVRSSELISKASVAKDFNINKFVKTATPSTGGTEPLADEISNQLAQEQNDQLQNNLQHKLESNKLSPQLLQTLFSHARGVPFLGGLLKSGTGRPLGEALVGSYYQSNPREITALAGDINASDSVRSDAAKTVLKVGVEALGQALMQNPDDPQLRAAAKDLVTIMPEQIASLLSGNDDKQSLRESFVNQGLYRQAPSTTAPVMSFDTAQPLGTFSTQPLPANGNGQIDQSTANDMSGLYRPIPPAHVPVMNFDGAQPLGPASAQQLQAKISGQIDQITAGDVSGLLDKMNEIPTLYRNSLGNLVDQYNQQLGHFGNQGTLSQSAAQTINQNRDRIAQLGFNLKQTANQDMAAAGELTRMSGPELQQASADLLSVGLPAMIASNPQAVNATLMDRTLQGLSQNPEVFKPLIYSMLSPQSDIPPAVYANGLQELLQTHPEMVMPEHVGHAISNLSTNPEAYSPVVGAMAEMFNQNKDKIGQTGQLSIPAAAELAVHADELATHNAPLILNALPNPTPELSAAIASKAASQGIMGLPDGLIHDGLDFTLQNQSLEFTPEQFALVENRARENPAEYMPLLNQVVEHFNDSNLDGADLKLNMPAMMTVASQENSLRDLGFEISSQISGQLKNLASSQNLDLGSLDNIEKAIREIPKNMSLPNPGENTTENAAKNTKYDELPGLVHKTAADQDELARDKVDIASSLGKKNSHSDNLGTLEDYALNVQSALIAGEMSPDSASPVDKNAEIDAVSLHDLAKSLDPGTASSLIPESTQFVLPETTTGGTFESPAELSGQPDLMAAVSNNEANNKSNDWPQKPFASDAIRPDAPLADDKASIQSGMNDLNKFLSSKPQAMPIPTGNAAAPAAAATDMMIDYQAIKDSTLPNVPFPETIVSAISVTPELEKILNHNRLDATIPPNTSIKIAEPLQVKSELSAGSVQNPAKPLNPSILPNQNKLSDNLQDFAANVQNAVGPSPDEIFLNPVPDAIAALSLKDQKD